MLCVLVESVAHRIVQELYKDIHSSFPLIYSHALSEAHTKCLNLNEWINVDTSEFCLYYLCFF